MTATDWSIFLSLSAVAIAAMSYVTASWARQDSQTRSAVHMLSTSDVVRARVLLERVHQAGRIRRREQAEVDAAMLLLIETIANIEFTGVLLRKTGGARLEAQRLYALLKRTLAVLTPAIEGQWASVDVSAACERANEAVMALPKKVKAPRKGLRRREVIERPSKWIAAAGEQG